jgi:hypothetical protein
MAEIDVTELLADPEFIDTFAVIRSSETINAHGRAVQTPRTYRDLFGVVQPASGRQLAQVPEGARSSENIEIWTDFHLQEATDSTAADIVLWNHKHYMVMHVDDWSNWGAGFVHVVCTRTELQSESERL